MLGRSSDRGLWNPQGLDAMTNFEFLKSNPRFAAFADAAVAAEKTLHVDAATCIVNCRRAMEFAVKWMYSADSALVLPYQEQLASLINTDAFKALLGRPLWLRVDFIRKVGNSAAHGGRKIKPGLATLCLRNLHAFLDFVACCYDENYRQTAFDEALMNCIDDARDDEGRRFTCGHFD